MEPEFVCFPEPLGCFRLPLSGASLTQEKSEEEDYADEFILSDALLAENLRAHDSPGCFLCVADTIGEED